MDKASQLDSLFYPRSIAVVGATNASFFGQYPRVLREFGFKGKLFAVNTKGEEVFGLKVYRSVTEIPEAVEAAAIIIPARFVPQALEECLAKGIKGGADIQLGVRGDGRGGGKGAGEAARGEGGAGDTAHRAELLRHLLSGRRPDAAPRRGLPDGERACRVPVAERRPRGGAEPAGAGARPPLQQGGQLRQRLRRGRV